MSDVSAERNKVTTHTNPVKAGERGPGRPKGSVNKTTALLKDAILLAAEKAGGKEGLVGYLTQQAKENPGPFLSLVGKVLPMQVTGDDGGAVKHEVTHKLTDEARDLLIEISGSLKS